MRPKDIIQHLNKFPKKKEAVLLALGVGVNKTTQKITKGKKKASD